MLEIYDVEAKECLNEIKCNFQKKFQDTYYADYSKTDQLSFNINVQYQEILDMLEQAIRSTK